jgi:aryl-alcohol dehydrogenase-like predicted oxidoreductase
VIENRTRKLGLGTVQFGLDYGVSNTTGQTSINDAGDILRFALKNNINTIDTASAYGTSEQVIGEFNKNGEEYNIVTKTIPIQKEKISVDDLEKTKYCYSQSLKRLNQDHLYGLLLHNADDLKAVNGKSLYRVLEDIKSRGRCKKVGVSVYNADQIDFVLDHFPIDLIQIPMNVFDQRLIHCGALKKLKEYGVEIHVRSAFLQGFVFMRPEELPKRFARYSKLLGNFRNTVEELDLSPAGASLDFLMQQPEIDKVICGVNSLAQFKELLATVSNLVSVRREIYDDFALDDDLFLNPMTWKDSRKWQ